MFDEKWSCWRLNLWFQLSSQYYYDIYSGSMWQDLSFRTSVCNLMQGW